MRWSVVALVAFVAAFAYVNSVQASAVERLQAQVSFYMNTQHNTQHVTTQQTSHSYFRHMHVAAYI